METVVPVLLLVGVGAFMAYRYFAPKRQRSQMNQFVQAAPILMPGAPIPDGAFVRIVGTVRPMSTVTAPLSGRACVAYRTTITTEVVVFGTTTKHETSEVFDMAPFVIERPEGPVVVDGSYAQLHLPPLPWNQLSSNNRERFVMSRGLNIREAARSEFTETVIEAGMQVCVAGCVVTDGGGPGAQYRAPTSQPRLIGNAQAPILILPV